ncbi:DUF1206 domain-containing protein [Gilvimarinus chinensis]|uniref:DUF1206 domain-containing protein n=1 Tax=Gilvimarinus chinensis TaxID=396005 RepID=UPI00039ADD3A|nr:DUF1206 domain-containing protein [Gilvimarinus chinensis]
MSLQKPALSFLARSGYAARGVVYLLVGGLAFLASINAGGKTTGGKGALQSLLDAPFGYVILTCLALGLTAYATWRTVQAVVDTDNHGKGAKALAIRASLIVSAVLHSLLAISVVRLLVSFGGSGGEGSKSLVSSLMETTAGRAVLVAVSAAIVVAGLAHAYKGWAASFDRHFSVPTHLQPLLYPFCRFGLVSRGLVLMVVGGLLLLAVYNMDASQVGGMDKAFSWLHAQVFGNIILAGVSLGLLAFASYSFIESRYRIIGLSR